MIKVVGAIDECRQIKFHLLGRYCAQATFVCLKEKSLFAGMILHFMTLAIKKESNVIIAVAFHGNSLEKLCVFITELKPADGASFFPVKFLILQEPQKVFLEDVSEVAFRDGKRSFVF